MNRRYRGSVVLVELIIVILFFALSQVVVLQVFAAAQEKTTANAARSTAVLAVQDTMECLSVSDDAEGTLLRLGYERDGEVYRRTEAHGVTLTATLNRLTQPAGVLTQVTVTAVRGEEELFSFPSLHYQPLTEATP